MKDSEFIVAVNTDANAPISDIPDVFLVGNLFNIVPALIREAKA